MSAPAEDLKHGDPVLVWMGGVAPGEGIPIGARFFGALEAAGSPSVARSPWVWLDTCSMGTHLPRRYRRVDVVPLDADGARAHGLCPDCLGYGATDLITGILAPAIDQVPNPCPACTGTGRPALRMEVTRAEGGVSFRMSAVPHEPVLIGGRSDCVACGMPSDDHLGSAAPQEP